MSVVKTPAVKHIEQMVEHYLDPDMNMGHEFTFLSHVDTEMLWRIRSVLAILTEGVDEHIDYRKDMDNHNDVPTEAVHHET